MHERSLNSDRVRINRRLNLIKYRKRRVKESLRTPQKGAVVKIKG